MLERYTELTGKSITKENRDAVIKDLLEDEGSTRYTPQVLAAQKALASEKESLEAIINNPDTDVTFDDLYKAFDKILEKVKELREETDRAAYSEGWKNLVNKNVEDNLVQVNRKNSVLFGFDTYGDNTFRQQQSLDYMGLPAGTSYKDFKESLFGKNYSEKNRDSLRDYISSLSKEEIKSTGMYSFLSKEAKSELNGLLDGSQTLDQVLNYGVKSSNNELIDFLINIQAQVENTKDVFKDLGLSLRETFNSTLLKGFDDTMVMAGNHVNAMIKGTYDASEAGEDYANIWKEVGQSMLSSMGPAVTQAGLALITDGNVKAGLALIAAGGILNFMSGLFGDDGKDKDKQQEERLKNLKDLLSDLIEQAKTDAEYYEKNFRHENALSQANQISVNDAIISPNGNVISTAPDDYLIATKTPGSLAGGKGTTVNFTVVNNSSNVAVKEERKNNPDGTVDIIATIVDVVSGAVADGTMDEAFAARDYRLNGQSYAY